MINKLIRGRLRKDNQATTIRLKIPFDVMESLKRIAPMRGFDSCRTLLASYISEGLRRDEWELTRLTVSGLTEALLRRGVSVALIQEALAEVHSNTSPDHRLVNPPR